MSKNKRKYKPHTKDNVEKINYGLPDEMEIHGFKENKTKRIISIIGGVLTLGIFTLLLIWRKQLKQKLTRDRCQLSEATSVLLKDQYGQVFEETVVSEGKTRYFYNKEIKYEWSEEEIRFLKLTPFDEGKRCRDITEEKCLTNDDAESRRKTYGSNEIKVKVTPITTLIVQEASNPFYIFQVYGLILWIIQEYYYYAAIVFSMSIISVGVTVYETRKQCKYLRDQVKVTGTAKTLRDNSEKEIPIQDLVPGDIIVLEEGGNPIPCDAVLLEGTCSVNESLLTGESVPITKVALTEDHQLFSYAHHRRNILLGGTELMQVRGNERNQVKALVIRTGFQSLKGELIRSILHPKPVSMHFYIDFLRCVGVSFCLGLVGFVYSAYVWIKNEGSIADIVLNSLDVLTFVVPPILPAALTASLAFAQNRLKKNNIYCLSSKYISLCGNVDIVCFDKTGTLTESDITIAGLVSVKNGRFHGPISDLETLDVDSDVITALATCHSVVKCDNTLQGNAADLAFFKASKWELLTPGSENEADFGFKPISIVRPPDSSTVSIAILKQFPFESVHQRMSVVTKRRGAKELKIIVKGAPEKIAQLCARESVPNTFDDVVNFYGKQGYRILAIAGGNLDDILTANDVAHNIKREDLEQDLVLYGLVVTQNEVKDVTYEAVSELQEADIETVMITGDNLQTALFVAKDVKIIHGHEQIIQVIAEEIPASINAAKHLKVTFVDPYEDIQMLGKRDPLAFKPVHNSDFVFCIEGSSVDLLYEQNQQLLEKILVRGRVFARMLPEQKVKLVEALQGIGRQVMMCGDGCNDCGALKAAHAGISLSMADASIAAPFTSKNQDISCVPHLIKEGRASSMAAFCSFQYGVAVCLAAFAGVLLMFSVSTEPSDLQYLYWSEAHILVPFLTLGNVAPWPLLVKRRPQKRLLAFLPMTTIVSFLLWQIIVYVIGWTWCHAQPWFEPFVYVPDKRPPNPSHDETVAWQLMMSSTLAAALALSPGPPYSKHILTNKIFAVWLPLGISLTTTAFFCRDSQFVYDMNLKQPPYIEFSVVLYLLAVSNILFCYIWERFFLRGIIYQHLMPFLESLRGPKEAYEVIEAEIRANPNWPPMGRKDEPRRVELPEIGETDEFTDSSASSEAEDFPLPLSPSPTTRHPPQDNFSQFVSFARKQMSFKTFGRSRRGAAYDIAGAKEDDASRAEEVPMSVMSEETEEGDKDGDVVMTTYKRLDVSDLPEEELQKRSEPLKEGPSDVELVNYREISSSTPFLAANGHTVQ